MTVTTSFEAAAIGPTYGTREPRVVFSRVTHNDNGTNSPEYVGAVELGQVTKQDIDAWKASGALPKALRPKAEEAKPAPMPL